MTSRLESSRPNHGVGAGHGIVGLPFRLMAARSLRFFEIANWLQI